MKQLTLQNAFRLYQSDCKARNLSPRSIEINDCGLKALQSVLGEQDALDSITPAVLRQFLTYMSEKNSSSTSARYYDVISAFLKWCVLEEFISENPAANIQKPRVKEPPISPLSVDDIDRMIQVCGNGFIGIRNKLIITLLYDTGMRATELANVALNDINHEQQLILVRYGKGNKTRVVPYGNTASKLLEKYLVLRGDLPTDRFIVTCFGDPTDRQRIRMAVVTTARKAKIKATTHLLRHSCAVAMIRNGCDVFSIQKLLGHTTLAMTRRYSQLADTDVQDKHRLFSPGDRVASLNRQGRRRLR